MSLGKRIRTLKVKANTIKGNLVVLFVALKKKETPWYAKAVVAVTVAYALSPIDLIPDFIPILGLLDDLVILPVLIFVALKLVPLRVLEECRKETEAVWKSGTPRKWYYGIPVFVVWLLCVALLLNALF